MKRMGRGLRENDFLQGLPKNFFPIICVLLFSLSLAGCCCFGVRSPQRTASPVQQEALSGVNVHVAPVPSKVRSVAVMPFRAATELIGSSTSDLFVTELLRTGRYQLLERGQLSQVLNEAEVALSGISDSRAVELGNMLGADGVIIGTVDEYGSVAEKGRNKAVVGLSVRMIDCESSRVMWSASFASIAANPSTPVSQHCRTVVRSTVMALSRSWNVQRQIPKQGGSLSEKIPTKQSIPRNEAPPSAPFFSLSDFGLREVELKWEAPDQSGVRYVIERSGSPSGPFERVTEIPASKSGYVDRGTLNAPLEDAKTYYYRLKAVTLSGLSSGPSSVKESMTAPPPSAPKSLQADAPSGRTVTLSWEPVGDEGIVKYIVERASPPDYVYETAGETESSDFSEGGTPRSPLSDSTVYRYRVRAANRVGAISKPSEVVAITTRPPPAVVEKLKATGDQPRRVPLSWRPSPEADVTGYQIERAVAAEGPFKNIAIVNDPEKSEYEDRGDMSGGWRSRLIPLEDSTRYWYRIRAVNSVESVSEWSEVADALTKPVPGRPRDVRAGSGGVNQITINWQANPEADIVAYAISTSDSADNFRQLARIDAKNGEPALSYTDNSLSPGATRHYRVRAIDADGLEGEWSEPVCGDTKPVPDAPTNLQCEWRDAQARLSWTAPPQDDIVKYRVWQPRTIFGNRELKVVEAPHCDFGHEDVGKKLKVVVTAIDADGLESEASQVFEIRRKQ